MSTKDKLMASLMGEEMIAPAPTASSGMFAEQNPPTTTTSSMPVPEANGSAEVKENGNSDSDKVKGIESVTAPESPAGVSTGKQPSLLERSGLLGYAAAGGGYATNTSEETRSGTGAGLFDAIDQQEQEKERQRIQAEEEERRRRAAEEAERRRQEEEMKRRQAEDQQQQQQLQDQMQSIHLGGGGGTGDHNGMTNQSMEQHYSQANFHASNPAAYSYQPHQVSGRIVTNQQQYYQQPQSFSNSSGMLVSNHPTQYQNVPSLTNTFQQQPGPAVSSVSSDFYRAHTPHQTQPSPSQQSQATSRYYQPQQTFSTTAGMHNPPAQNMGQPPQFGQGRLQQPTGYNTSFPSIPPPVYGVISVIEPVLVQAPRVLGIGQPPYWTYQVVTQLLDDSGQPQQQAWYVRRRFRHVVALEDRLREEIPGAILPPRPDKHVSRALEEATAQQSTDFVQQRSMEVQHYLQALAKHPYASRSQSLRLFLMLQDDMGTAWPECSSNALTRIANVGVGAAVKVSEQTGRIGSEDKTFEDNAELLSLQSSEQVRIGAVVQAVPKLEGSLTLWREYAEQALAVGMEVSRLAKEVQTTDMELGQPLDLASQGMLRSGRRNKRLALELNAAMETFIHQYKLCRYERLAMQDRRNAMVRRWKERGKADQRASQFVQRTSYNQNPYQPYQQPQYSTDALAQEAVYMDSLATDASRECEEIGHRLKEEIIRVGYERRREWKNAIKVVASSMKEGFSENVAIWETVRENFQRTFPGMDS